MYNKATKLCLLVKDVKIIVDLNKNNKEYANIICILDLIDASTNYVLDVKLNTDFLQKYKRRHNEYI